ncbi:hypothetical protein, partial [Herminiimonas sp. CN]|uniref:hypothetical protein n=1 Tax=Herminiimonas sp. CN TaxID=1349818 RepID=UPI001EE657B3
NEILCINYNKYCEMSLKLLAFCNAGSSLACTRLRAFSSMLKFSSKWLRVRLCKSCACRQFVQAWLLVGAF